MHQKITSNIWFNTQAKQAVEFYKSVFNRVTVHSSAVLHNTPSGDTDIITLSIEDHAFTFINAGPIFTPNPSISYTVACESEAEAQDLWNKLSKNAKVLMEFTTYPFATKYGWVEDQYHISWQISYTQSTTIRQKITPSFLFTGSNAGNVQNALDFYTAVFRESGIEMVNHYDSGQEPNTPDMINYSLFRLEGQLFIAMESALDHAFSFNEGISLIVHCETQDDIDYYWDKLTAVPEAEQCGWLKDKYGVSWQIVPTEMETMMASTDEQAQKRVTNAFLEMKKFDIAHLQKAFRGE